MTAVIPLKCRPHTDRDPGAELRLRPGVARALFVGVMATAIIGSGATARAGELRLASDTQVTIDERTLTLVGLVGGEGCVEDAMKTVSAAVGRHVSRFIALPDPGSSAGVVVLDNGRTVNELLLETGCPRFDPTGLPAADPFVKGMARAAARGRSAQVVPVAPPTPVGTVTAGAAPSPAALAAAATGAWNIVSKWAGSGERTTDVFVLPAGEVRIVTLAVPSGKPTGQIMVVVRDEQGTILQTIAAGPLTTKHMTSTPVRLARESRVQLAITGTDVFWGVWAQIPR